EIEWKSCGLTTVQGISLVPGLQFASYDIESISLNQSDAVLYFSASHRGGKMRIYSSSFLSNVWTSPKPLQFSTPISDDHYPYYDNETQTLYFASRRTGSIGGLDIWSCMETTEGFAQPKNLGPGVNTPMNEIQPTICRHDLIFSSDQDVQNAGFDLRLSSAKSGFTSSLSLPDNINSLRNDLRLIQVTQNQFILLRTDHKKTESMEWITFSLDEELPDFTYRLMRNNTPAQYAKIIISSDANSPVILESDIDGHLPLTSIRSIGRLQIKLSQEFEPCDFQVLNESGEILLTRHLTPGETISLEPLDLLFAKGERWYPGDESRILPRHRELMLPSGFELCINELGEPLALTNNRISQGTSLHKWQVLSEISANCQGELPKLPLYLPMHENEMQLAESKNIQVNNTNDCWRIDRIYFDSSSDTIDLTAMAQCKILQEIMILNPGLQLELLGGTDFYGETEFNHHLGLQRALAIKEELMKANIQNTRILIQSRGEKCGCTNDSPAIKQNGCLG
ncbi:MAG: OmpA family protein, partial [Flavobacteriales bacterium]